MSSTDSSNPFPMPHQSHIHIPSRVIGYTQVEAPARCDFNLAPQGFSYDYWGVWFICSVPRLEYLNGTALSILHPLLVCALSCSVLTNPSCAGLASTAADVPCMGMLTCSHFKVILQDAASNIAALSVLKKLHHSLGRTTLGQLSADKPQRPAWLGWNGQRQDMPGLIRRHGGPSCECQRY